MKAAALFPSKLACCLSLALGAFALTPPAWSQTAPSPAPASSNMDGELFYQLLLGELQVRGGDPGAGYSLVLDAARRTLNPQLFRRAVEIALQARSGEAALSAANAWAESNKDSSEALRYKLQILLALNRVADTPPVLRQLVAQGKADTRDELILSIPQTLSRVGNKPAALLAVREALREELANGPHGSAAWVAVGRMELAAGRMSDALDAAQRAQTASVRSRHAAALALELMEDTAQRDDAEALVKRYLGATRDGDRLVELAYARVLVDTQRSADALKVLSGLADTRDAPADTWLVLGTLHARDNRDAAANAALQTYLEKTEGAGDAAARGRTQAFLLMAQLAEKRRDFTSANGWLDRIDNPQEVFAAQMRRASILARQGQLDAARELLQKAPERLPTDARAKLVAEAQLLRDHKRFDLAYPLYTRAVELFPDDTDLVYEQAMVAEKAGRFDDMERLLRALIAREPDHHHAYNALGYSLAERNQRLPEAKQLIEQALARAPDDPYIQDSLGWVEFRMGNIEAALRILQRAYEKRPDAEIAAHLGEVLWVAGQREHALNVWREGLLLNNENETLTETLQRLQAKP
jgi:tetratricopeptide (TPR) repeat protein